MISRKIFGQLAEIILEGGAVKATKYFGEREVVKATRICFGRVVNKRHQTVSIVFTVGRPNYAERQFIAKAKKASEPFPIKKIQIKWATKK